MSSANHFPDYYEYNIRIAEENPSAESELSDILMAELAEYGFESFVQEPGILLAYVKVSNYNPEMQEYLLNLANDRSVSRRLIEGQNWNAVWESGFEPITILDKCRVRAEFHQPDKTYPIELVITPKMSFGTGHHATTRLVMEEMFKLDWSNKTVLDMGCGTGILAMLASKLGASTVYAVDNDPQCVLSTTENFVLNGIKSEFIYQTGNIDSFPLFDRIMANIQKNIILEQLSFYSQHLVPGGILIVSGIRQDDLEDINEAAGVSGLNFDYFKAMNDWIMIRFNK